MAGPLASDASTIGVQASYTRVSTQTQVKPSLVQPVASVNRLAAGLDQVSIKPHRIEQPKGMTTSLNSSLAGVSMSPTKRFTPRATADYSSLGQGLKAQMTQSYPKATPEISDATAPKLENVRGPIPPVKPNTEALHKMRGSVPPDTNSVFGNAAATVSKLRPIRDSLSLKVGNLSVGQGRALMDAGMKTAAAQAEVVRQNMDETKTQMDNSRRRLKAMQERQREHSVRIVQRLRVKFDSIPQHLQDFAARAGKEVVVPAGLEETPLEKMLSGAGVVSFKGPGMAAYEAHMASQ
jgi:hypothetical protein